MSKSDAARLKHGDKVLAVNGKYSQSATVVAVEPHNRDGYWVTYEWTPPNGKGKKQATKRHNSVYHPRP